ncbi:MULTISPECIES: nitrite reductase [Aeromicrobium]|uniref:nitrite reductase n=1 Tax=Aeromicrobium TaxID=2040 RepID=UPI00257FD92E|nr:MULTISPECIES: nitrite reductase [Aeromicrobium]
MTGRTRRDLCPGLLRPWIADDGALIRVRIPGGAVSVDALGGLLDVARDHGDATVHLTSRANLQARAIPHDDGCLSDAVVDAVMATGLMPSTSHERIRNVMASPLTGRSGGRADLRPVVEELDRRLCAEPSLAALAGRFLFVLDDGRGDVLDRDLDLGLVALDADTAQVRVGSKSWGPVVPLPAAAEALAALASRFVELAGARAKSPWHVDELPGGGAALLTSPSQPHPGTRVSSAPPDLGRIEQVDGRIAWHLPVPDGRLDARLFDEVRAHGAHRLVVTPWRTLIVPDLENA